MGEIFAFLFGVIVGFFIFGWWVIETVEDGNMYVSFKNGKVYGEETWKE